MQLAPALIALECVKNELIESIPIKVQHNPALEAGGSKPVAGKRVTKVNRMGVTALNIQHTDLI